MPDATRLAPGPARLGLTNATCATLGQAGAARTSATPLGALPRASVDAVTRGRVRSTRTTSPRPTWLAPVRPLRLPACRPSQGNTRWPCQARPTPNGRPLPGRPVEAAPPTSLIRKPGGRARLAPDPSPTGVNRRGTLHRRRRQSRGRGGVAACQLFQAAAVFDAAVASARPDAVRRLVRRPWRACVPGVARPRPTCPPRRKAGRRAPSMPPASWRADARPSREKTPR